MRTFGEIGSKLKNYKKIPASWCRSASQRLGKGNIVVIYENTGWLRVEQVEKIVFMGWYYQNAFFDIPWKKWVFFNQLLLLERLFCIIFRILEICILLEAVLEVYSRNDKEMLDTQKWWREWCQFGLCWYPVESVIKIYDGKKNSRC
jgi:hypothetical protein